MERYKPVFEKQNDYISYLLEHTFDIDKDVELLYLKSNFKYFVEFFKDFTEDINIILPKNLEKIIKNKQSIILLKTQSNILKTEESKKSHEINPISIELGIFHDGSYYHPKENKIQISLNYSVIKILSEYSKYGIKVIEQLLKKSDFRSFINYFSKTTIKASIIHELSHWISDSLYNKHLTNKIELSIKLDKSISTLLKIKNVDMSYFEIDAQVHAIKQLKKSKKKDWDKYSLTDIFFLYPSLNKIFLDLHSQYSKEIAKIWIKNLISRMNRENLLGKNMKSFPDIKKLTESLFRI